jgi:hypothetical protein
VKKDIFEKLIVILIIFSVIQIFLDEFGRFDLWSVLVRNSLTLAGFFFDSIFSIEFIIRSILAYKKNDALRYIKYGRGWIDFLSSFPLLLLDLPAVYLLFSGNVEESPAASALLAITIFIYDIRITRILRFVRIAKMFGKLPMAASPMTKHHTSAVSAIVIFTIICSLAFSSLLGSNHAHKIVERTHFFDESVSLIKYLESKSKISYNDVAKKMFAEDKNLLNLSYKNDIIISRISDEKFEEYFSRGDYATVNNRGFVLQFSIVDLNREEAHNNIICFFIIILVSFSVMFIYGRHFAATVSSVISKIIMGFRSRQYSEQVNIRDEFDQDEVYKLAKFYNDVYLPAKLKSIDKGGLKS